MTVAVPAPKKPYIGPSESQAIADAQARREAQGRPHLERHWSSETDRRRRRTSPPAGVDALVAWLRREVELEAPGTLHRDELWRDRVSKREVTEGVEPVGGSLIGTLAYTEPFRQRLEESAHQKDGDAELLRPLQSAMATLRRRRRWGHDALVVLINVAHFDWRSMADRAVYGKRTLEDGTEERYLVRFMDEGVLRDVLEATITELWWLHHHREPFATGGS